MQRSLGFIHPSFCPSSLVKLLLMSISATLCCLSIPPLSAQTLTFAGASPVNFGNVNLCAAGKTTPAPCSATVALTYNVTESGTLGPIKVLTLASPNLDFTLAAGTTCAGAVVAGTKCVVEVNFAPRYPGARPGAVVITDESGKYLATTSILGSGVGPQIGFDPGTLLTLPYTFAGYVTPALDGANDIFVAGVKEDGKTAADGKIFLEKFPAVGGAPISIPVTTGAEIGFSQTAGLALNSVGDLFFTDGNSEFNGIAEIPAGGGAQISLLSTGVSPKVDGANNLYVSGLRGQDNSCPALHFGS
jgi:hypothetical protein